ncbi:hypothetical protein OAH62_00415 [Candidatus Marinimicrobia bacterium]|nr:hypothetical protein [Candidatus Neomarinimicrobiota bacterium]
MKFRYIILFLFTSLMQSNSNNLYLELFGPSIQGSINYERTVKENFIIRVGAGIPLIIEESSILINNKLEILPIIIGANYLRGNKFKLDVGGGAAFWMMDYEGDFSIDLGGLDLSSDGNYLVPYTSLGLRYQKQDAGFNLRLGLSILVINIDDTSGTLPILYLGSGFSF